MMQNDLFTIEEEEQNVESKVVKYYIVKSVTTGETLYKFSIFIGGDIFVSQARNIYIESNKVMKIKNECATKLVPKYKHIIFNQDVE